MIQEINYHDKIIQFKDVYYDGRRFKGGSTPHLQPSPMQPTKMSAEIGAVKRDMDERRRISTGRVQSIMSIPGLATVNPNLNVANLKDKLG